MSDKSKLGFNINPKNYDELNSTDNLVISGSDSGWLGKKLQGDDSNDLDLSKINPLFDKELYEKYRPGVNTNDGSVNQDIWGYKCFNSPVSFRNGIYGDTYSIKSINGVESDVLGKSTYTGVSTAVNDKNPSDDNTLDNVHYSFNNTTEALTITAKSNIASTYTGKLRQSLNATVIPTYDLSKKEPRVYGSSIENEASVIGDIRSDYFWLYTYCNPDKTKLNIYNGINVYSSNAPTQYINERNEINIASTIFNDDNTGTAQDIEHAYSESRVTVGTNCKEDIVIKDYTSASGNCIRMYSTNGRYHNAEYINDNISSIIITPDYISISSKNNANQSADNPHIKIDGADNSITLHAGKLNLPDTIETTTKFAVKAGALSKEINSANYIYATDNSILPSNDSVISLGSESYKYSNIYADRLIGIASAAENLVYVNTTNNAETELLTVSNENLILPRGNKTIQLGRADNRFGTIYGDLNGTAVLADHAATAEQATKDQHGSIIDKTYLNIKDYGRNDIESYNAIIGGGERLFFFDEKYFDTNSTIPPIHKSYSSIGTSGTYETECYNLYISKTLAPNSGNPDEDITPRTKKCCVSCELKFDSETAIANFSIYPKTSTSDTFESVDSMNIGKPDAPWDELYCNKFPTIAGTTDTTSVGNIRLLCIKGPAGLTTIEHEIKHGSIIKNPMQIGGKQFTIHIANLRIVDNSQNFIGVTGENDTVEGEWQLLSSALVVANSPSKAVFTPVLAMRVL